MLILLPLVLVGSLQLAQLLLKQSWEQRLAPQTATTILVDKASIVWEEEGRELQIGGRYFDVRSIKEAGSKLVLQGHYDDTETAVWQLLKHALRHSRANGYQLVLLLQMLLPIAWIRFHLSAPSIPLCWQGAKTDVLPTPPPKVLLAPPRNTGSC